MRFMLTFILLLMSSCTVLNNSQGGAEVQRLIKNNWFLKQFSNKSILKEVEINLTINRDGKIGGNGGANNYFAHWQFQGYNIKSSRISATKRYRLQPQGVMKQEEEYFKALSNTNRWAIVDGDLYLYQSDVVLLIFSSGLE